VEQIVDDSTTPVADEPVDTEAASEPVADQPVTEATPAGGDDTVDQPEVAEQSDQDDSISGEQARKLRSEASNLRSRLRDTESEVEALKAQLAERDSRLASAESGRLNATIYGRAAGKLHNPADAIAFIDTAGLDADDIEGIDAAIDALLDERNYLAVSRSIPQIEQGVQRERPRGKTFSDVMAEGLGWAGK
jgi:hypothetical protein